MTCPFVFQSRITARQTRLRLCPFFARKVKGNARIRLSRDVGTPPCPEIGSKYPVDTSFEHPEVLPANRKVLTAHRKLLTAYPEGPTAHPEVPTPYPGALTPHRKPTSGIAARALGTSEVDSGAPDADRGHPVRPSGGPERDPGSAESPPSPRGPSSALLGRSPAMTDPAAVETVRGGYREGGLNADFTDVRR